MATLMWFGPGPSLEAGVTYPVPGAWIPCPQAPMEAASTGNAEETKLLDGGSYIARSPAAAKAFQFLLKGDDTTLQPFKSMFDGSYGKGPYYFIDPSSVSNVLPPHWADPSLTAMDTDLGSWPYLRKVTGVGGTDPYPTRQVTPITGYSSPPFAAQYLMQGSATTVWDALTPRCTLIIPPTDTMYLRIWGVTTGTAWYQVRMHNRSTGAITTANLTPTAAGVTANYSGATYSHLEIWMGKTGAASAAIVAGGMVATTVSAPTAWTAGRGHSGAEFNSELAHSIVSSRIGRTQKEMGATLTEVGSWQI